MTDNMESGGGPLNIVIIGSNSQGKSSLGNLLVRRTAFTSCPSTAAQVAEGHFKNYNLVVIDWPGSRTISTDKVREQVSLALSVFVDGINVFLIVVKYGDHLSGKWKEILSTWKQVLGPQVFALYGVVVITFGDDFLRHVQANAPGMTFRDWCRQQTGDLRSCFDECGGRVLLCNNNPGLSATDKEKIIIEVINFVEHNSFAYSRNVYDAFNNQQPQEQSRRLTCFTKLALISVLVFQAGLGIFLIKSGRLTHSWPLSHFKTIFDRFSW